MSAFFHHILSVFLRSPKKPVIRILAGRIIAFMTYIQSSRYFPKSSFISVPVSTYRFIVIRAKFSIFVFSNAFHPRPAFINHPDLKTCQISFPGSKGLPGGIPVTFPAFIVQRAETSTNSAFIFAGSNTTGIENILKPQAFSTYNYPGRAMFTLSSIVFRAQSKRSTRFVAIINNAFHVFNYNIVGDV